MLVSKIKSMFKRRDPRASDERLDRIGREILRSAALPEAEAENASSSPFLYACVRARIAAERKRRDAGENWLNVSVVARRAVPAMALSAALAFGVFWFGDVNAPLQQPSDDDVLFAANDTRIGSIVFDDQDALSNDEVLDTIMNGDEPEASR